MVLASSLPSSVALDMPAKNLLRINTDGTYCHIYNRGIEERIIFDDEQDYEVFLGYLKDYLTPSQNSEVAKRVFNINGRSFRGIPHQPKNYFNKVELIAYSLMPNHFHLLLHQKTKGSLERFIRSLCTRYSMYFNKKYQRTGPLFEGPYKSIHVDGISQLSLLTQYFHQEGGYSSYPEYLGQRETSWVNIKVVLSIKGINDYRKFVEKYELNQKEKELLKAITLERRDPLGNEHVVPDLKPAPRVPEFLAAIIIFFVLFGLGVRNITISAAKKQVAALAPASQVLSDSTESTDSLEPTAFPTTESPVPSDSTEATNSVESTPSSEPQPKTMVMVKITDGAATVNIRQNPTTRSEKIGEAKDGDVFEFVSINSGWYEIKLTDGSPGFISSTYIFPVETNNQ